MLPLFRQVHEEMEKIDPAEVRQRLKGKPERHQRVVGKASDELLRLWGVVDEQHRALDEYARRGLHMVADIVGKPRGDVKKQMAAFMRKGDQMKNRRELLANLFWLSVNQEFPETVGMNAEIMADGQIVVWDHEDEPHALVIEGHGIGGLLKAFGIRG